MKRMLWVCALSAAGLCAQTAGVPGMTPLPPGFTFKVYTLKHAKAETVSRLLGAFGVTIQRSDNTIAVSGPKDAMNAVDEAVKVLETSAASQPAHKSVQLTGYMILASLKPGEPSSVPADLEPVIKQLKGAFPYTGYRMLDSFVLRVTDDARNSFINGVVPNIEPQVDRKIDYSFRIPGVEMLPDNSVRLRDSQLQVNVPVGGGLAHNVSITSTVDIREGQKIVVGKSNLGSADAAFFLVLTSKLLD